MAEVFLPRGTRDLLPRQMGHRLRVIDTLRRVFSRYGFEPLETPALERIETLTGKCGEEGDQLIYRILKRGAGAERGEADLALRYDLTVPLARVVAMHPDLPMPFKRSQIQPVWRADRPQKGRYREFWQCDVDTVGTDSRVADAECLAVANDALQALGFGRFAIRLNDRRLLNALAAEAGAAGREAELCVCLDKLDRVGWDGVRAELEQRGFSAPQADRIPALLQAGAIPGTDEVERELQEIVAWAEALGVPAGRIVVDRWLARGMDYYTGPVFEVVADEPLPPREGGFAGEAPRVGSIAGGGRYDGLIGVFAGRRVPAVGVSLGLERIFVVMEELGWLPEQAGCTRVFVTVFSAETVPASLRAAAAFRAANIPAEVALRGGRLGRQIEAAAKRSVPFAVVVGPDEVARGGVVLRDLRTGAQRDVSLQEAVRLVAEGP